MCESRVGATCVILSLNAGNFDHSCGLVYSMMTAVLQYTIYSETSCNANNYQENESSNSTEYGNVLLL